MKSAWPSLLLQLQPLLIVSLLVVAAGCRDQVPDTTSPVNQLTGPTLFVPVGILRYPQGIAVDATGDVWVSDTNGDRITRFTPAGSQRLSQGGVLLPSYMGLDRSTNHILVVSQNVILRVNPQNETTTIVTTITGSSIDASAVVNVRTGESAPRTVTVRQLGDIDGTPAGDIFVSAVTPDAENYLLRVRSGEVTALAFSDVPPGEVPAGVTRFVCADAFGSIFTAFVLPNAFSVGVARPFLVFPSNPAASRALASGPVGDGARGGGIDRQGNLYVADSRNRQLIIISTNPERELVTLDIPDISGITEAAPWDVAIAPDGTVYVAIVDLFDTSRQSGAVIKYTRSG